MEISYPWYTATKDICLGQGDFIDHLPIPMPESYDPDEATLKYEVVGYDTIILSQSCDLQHDKIGWVLVCPYQEYPVFAEENPGFKSSKLIETLKRGNISGYHLLERCDISGFEKDNIIVDFKSTFSVPLAYLKDNINFEENRLRLLPPYREHLSQQFARFFMRVGLPLDIHGI